MSRAPSSSSAAGSPASPPAYYLTRAGFPVTVVERAPVLGGLCGSFQSRRLHPRPRPAQAVLGGARASWTRSARLLGDRLIEHKKKNRIRLLGRYLDYPLSLGNLLPLLGPVRAAKLGLGYAGAMAGGVMGGEPATYEEYILRRFGRGVYELVFEPLAWKVWGDPQPALGRPRPRAHPFRRRGGADPAAAEAEGDHRGRRRAVLLLPARRVRRLPGAAGRGDPRRGRAHAHRRDAGAAPGARRLARHRGRDRRATAQTERLPCETLVSSIPIHALGGLLFPGDAAVAADVARLRLRDLALVFVFLGRDRLVDDHWIFFPERQYPFNRMFEQKSMDPELGPKGRTAICCDLTCDEGDPTWSAPDDDLVQRCFDALVEAGLAPADSFEGGIVRRFRSFYPMYTVDYKERLTAVYGRLEGRDNLVLTGRLGMFNYNNSDHCLDMGRFIAAELAEGAGPAADLGGAGGEGPHVPDHRLTAGRGRDARPRSRPSSRCRWPPPSPARAPAAPSR